jgi:hypothetical protein
LSLNSAQGFIHDSQENPVSRRCTSSPRVFNTLDIIAYGQDAHSGKEENGKNTYPSLKKSPSKASVLRSYANTTMENIGAGGRGFRFEL